MYLFVCLCFLTNVDIPLFVFPGLVEERIVCLGQQHSRNKVVVVVAAIVKDSTI